MGEMVALHHDNTWICSWILDSCWRFSIEEELERYTYFNFVDETNYKVRVAIWRFVEMVKAKESVFANEVR